jgi:hypothetical protein
MNLIAQFMGMLCISPIQNDSTNNNPLWSVRQLTQLEQHHELDHNENFSFDDQWLAFDARPDPDGIAQNTSIGKVHVGTGEMKVIYQTKNPTQFGPGVGAVSYHPTLPQVIFIHGPEDANEKFPYAGHRRVGAIMDESSGKLTYMDARNVIPPYIPGALRGGTHRHQWSADGNWVGFTYNDAIMVDLERQTGQVHDLRTIGVAHKYGPSVTVPEGLGKVQGEWFSALLVIVVPTPSPGSNQISRAYGDWWIGEKGYPKPSGGHQRARAFMGDVVNIKEERFTEVFMVDVPERIDQVGGLGPLAGTDTTMPAPPKGAKVHRLTHSEDNPFPGIATEVRHWLTSSPCGTWISYLAKDEEGIIQVFLVSTLSRETLQATHHDSHVQGTVRWHPSKPTFAYLQDNSIFLADVSFKGLTGNHRRITPRSEEAPFAICWSRSGESLAFNRYVHTDTGRWMHIFLAGRGRD